MKVTKKIPDVPYSRYDQIQRFLRKKRKEILVFLEHTSCITGGINYNTENLLVQESFLRDRNIELLFLKRGGDFTAHEKGQLVIYPHIDLKKRNLSIAIFLRNFMDSIQDSIQNTWELEVTFKESDPGLYLKSDLEKKLVSVGINFKSFFTSFGAAINIQNSLETFSFINPCGKKSKNIVSIKSLGLDPNKENKFIDRFTGIFLQKLGSNIGPQ